MATSFFTALESHQLACWVLPYPWPKGTCLCMNLFLGSLSADVGFRAVQHVWVWAHVLRQRLKGAKAHPLPLKPCALKASQAGLLTTLAGKGCAQPTPLVEAGNDDASKPPAFSYPDFGTGLPFETQVSAKNLLDSDIT